MKSGFIGSAIFTGFFLAGYALVFSSSETFTITRDPAAVRQSFDFSHLRGDALEQAIKQRMIAGLEIHRSVDSIGFSIGHFTFMNESGQKALACREYDTMTLTFEAEGVVVNGERPSMEIEGKCHFSEDLSSISPLYLPVSRILGERPADGEFQFRETAGSAHPNVAVRFANLADEWPRQWVMTSVNLSSAMKAKVSIQRNELRRLVGEPLMVHLESTDSE